ncbi:helix-turn-helix domain-containing protein [Haloferula sp.]|uniref:helix-turn-helix domain-containing protein n=1 Tax=Haloferula sp. TaxID=2497595 RepID=UPI003C752D1C
MIFDALPRLRSVLPSSDALTVTFGAKRIWSNVREGLRDLETWWGGQPAEILLAENAMERVLLLACREYGLQRKQTPDDRIQDVIAYIDERLGEELSVEVLARVAGLSASRFAHLFRERTGLSPAKFLETRRIEKARHLLLTTDQPVQTIGHRIGFPNAQHFSIRFHKMIGQSPSAFRKAPRRRFRELNPP